jgi:cation diffusion facilitator CzcD-associated flavoprotein CzcO
MSLTAKHQFRKDSTENRRSSKVTTARMRAALNNDPQLCETLIPKWVIGCRRLTPGEGYLESFLLPTVTLEQSPISQITTTGITTTAGQHHDLDVIICATGFNVSHIPPFPVIGRSGHSLAELWKDEPESYLSVMCPSMPNCFFFTGPNATVGHGTLLTSMGWTAEYILRWCGKIAGEGIHSTAPTKSATQEFVRYGDKIHDTLTWSGTF